MTENRTCQHCWHKLYRSAEAGTKVRKDAPYVVCRNPECPSKRKHLNRRDRAEVKKRKRGHLTPEPLEDEKKRAITLNRQRVREFVAKVSEGQEPMAVMLLLAMACEEAGCPEAAALISAQHRLDLLGYNLAT